jgi:hypothetical protein
LNHSSKTDQNPLGFPGSGAIFCLNSNSSGSGIGIKAPVVAAGPWPVPGKIHRLEAEVTKKHQIRHGIIHGAV